MPFNGLVRVQPTRKKWGSRKNCKRAAEKRTFKRQTLAKIKRETPHMWPMGESHTSTNHNFHHFEQWKSFYPVCVVCRSLCMRWLISPIRQYFLLDSSLRMQPVCLCGAHYFWPQCKPETELRARMKIYYTGIVNCEGSRKKESILYSNIGLSKYNVQS